MFIYPRLYHGMIKTKLPQNLNLHQRPFSAQWYFLVNPVMHEIADTENLHSRKLISDMHLFNVMVDLMAQN